MQLRQREVNALLQELESLHAAMLDAPCDPKALLDVHPDFERSAQNLRHYLAFRRRDLRGVQMRLAALGLSSLGRAESHVLAAVESVLFALRAMAGQGPKAGAQGSVEPVDLDAGRRLLGEHAEALFGPEPKGRAVRIMVTMPSEASTDYGLVRDLLKQGMNCMRINCAHDGPEAWSRMIDHLRRAERELGLACKVAMDLAGPKLRTGPLKPGPSVVKVRPRRDALGRVLVPATVWLTAREAPSPPPKAADAVLPVARKWLALAREGEYVELTDARGRRRSLAIVDVQDGGVRAYLKRTAYVVPGTLLHHRGRGVAAEDRAATVGELPATEAPILLHAGDRLIVTRDLSPGEPGEESVDGRPQAPAHIGCSISEVFDDVRPGEPIFFDDGKIGGVVEDIEPARALVRITSTGPAGAKLRGDKGINLPESALRLGALTDEDRESLEFAVKRADIVELSFVGSALDVTSLLSHIEGLGSARPAVVLKIETRRGFECLPELLFAVMKAPRAGIMIARGDLAIECGFERLAEVQEEILWMSEAAHVPVIWATQVLESLAKNGLPSRAEITDAAMGNRAECVMLNKGPCAVRAVAVLDDILRRMERHQSKKSALLRELRVAHSR